MITPSTSLSDDAYLTLYTICRELSDKLSDPKQQLNLDIQISSLIYINCVERLLSQEEFLAAFMELCCDDLESKLEKFLLH